MGEKQNEEEKRGGIRYNMLLLFFRNAPQSSVVEEGCTLISQAP